MATRVPSAETHRVRERKLVALLAKADRAVRELQRRAASIRQSGHLRILGFRRRQLEELEALLAQGARVLDGRLYTLDGSHTQDLPLPGQVTFSNHALLEPVTFFAAYRACCRALCAAMEEAARLADRASALALRGLVLQLEKQLWMIDEPDRSRGVEDRRAVSLFLSC